MRGKAAYNSSIVERQNFDAEYVDRLTKGDRETEKHFTRYFDELLSIKLRSRLRSPHVIDDVKQETFLRVMTVLRRKGGIEKPGALGAFVNSVCNNILFEIYRDEARFTEVTDNRMTPEADAETAMSQAQERAAVRAVISELGPKDQNILRWLYLEERDKDEICRHFDVDREYLRVLLHRAKQRFREAYLKQDDIRPRPATNRDSPAPRG